ncbi:uncharacterized protein [Panulirus ornatus]|uniref:uncharacterized protein isoform X4 n=1 Tax=Panulirus ornatus TaxID=150431 RepID=UPI003A8AC89A
MTLLQKVWVSGLLEMFMVWSGPVIFPELRVSGTTTIDQTVNIRNPLEGSSANQSLEEYVAAVSELQTEVQLLKDALPTVLYHSGQQAITGFISAASLTVDNAHFDELTLHKVNGHSLDSITRKFLLDGVDQNVQESWRANYMEVDVFTTRGSPIAGTISGVLTSGRIKFRKSVSVGSAEGVVMEEGGTVNGIDPSNLHVTLAEVEEIIIAEEINFTSPLHISGNVTAVNINNLVLEGLGGRYWRRSAYQDITIPVQLQSAVFEGPVVGETLNGYPLSEYLHKTGQASVFGNNIFEGQVFVQGDLIMGEGFLDDNVDVSSLQENIVTLGGYQNITGLIEEYDAVFEGYKREGIIEEVPEGEMNSPYPTFYLPHHPVVREVSTTSKVRPVFDASAVSYNGVSLNHCLEVGPPLNPQLVEVLMRFRRWKVALTGDITKAFLQINVRKEDRDVYRFLWNYNGDIRIMRFTRVPFGNKSSPFLLNATVKHHLKSFPDSEVIAELKDNLYVDDWLSGADSTEEAFAKFDEARSVLSKASMTLSKWSSNCNALKDRFNDYLEPSKHAETKILCLQWCLTRDRFSFDCLELKDLEVASTKRAVLSVISKLFDPLGLLCPIIMMAKIMFQDIWRLGLSWDEILPTELQHRFQKWVQNIKVLNTWQVNRCYFPELVWNKLQNVELHAFGDASEKGYGACVYLRVPDNDGSFKVILVLAKGRVAPIKKLSVPRLELMGARLSVFVKTSLHLIDVQIYCWTDSKVALSWIKGKGDPNRWKTCSE